MLEQLRTDPDFAWYRRQSGGTAEAQSVLVLVAASTHPQGQSLRRIEREYALRAELDPAWAVRPLKLSHEDGRTILVCEDPGGQPLERLIQGPMEIAQFLRIAVGLASALSQMHRRGLIHKDVKPQNVLVDAATGRAWLMGFGLTSKLSREWHSPEPPEFIVGSLPYMAPEQTGRMNRSVDSRSDLYAFGVTLYEMLTGSLPFAGRDPMEWVHCHIARQPVPPAERRTGVPAPVSAILMKLLAKTADERYQTAAGVESDLRRCWVEWQAQGRIGEFALGAHDTSDRLLLSEKLYGRQAEIDALITALDRVVKTGRTELVLVSGYSGVGKSSVVNELHKVLVPPRGLFACGKFDQYKRDIPYSTLAQALQSLIRPLLSKSEPELSRWRSALREALDPNGGLMAELVPELRLILGEQPPVPDLPPQDSQRRFHLVLRRLIGVFARPEHPLALFLDDLQWLDAATLDLLESLSIQGDVRHLMLIGAYRANEVSSDHPLIHKVEAIRNLGATVQEITVAPLNREDLGHWIAHSLRCEVQSAAALVQVVHEKTGGNPFFVIQFIDALAAARLLVFDTDAARWSWDLARIQAQKYTDNVFDLMAGKLSRLPVATQEALQQLACLGNTAETSTLGIVLGKAEDEVDSDLWEAVRLELIERMDHTYKFAHDRVQEAAYSLIPELRRADAHLRIGRLLLAHTPLEERDKAIFEIVSQLNRGAKLMTETAEREQLAELNLMAGRRAKTSAAYASALDYFSTGTGLLPIDCWDRRHDLSFALELHRAECEFLTGAQWATEQRLNTLSTRAATTIERASVACVRADVYLTFAEPSRAIAVGLEYLQHLGVQWSPHPTDDDVRREFEKIWARVGSRPIQGLTELPLMRDPESVATMDVLNKIWPAAFIAEPNIYALIICFEVSLGLDQGYTDASPEAYAGLGLIAGVRFGDYKSGFRFGELGCELVERRGLERFQHRTYFWFCGQLMPRARHVRAARDLLRRAFEIANKRGDLTFAGYSCYLLIDNLFASGDPLIEAQREAEQGLEFAQKTQFGPLIDNISSQLALIGMLRGLTRKFGSFDGDQFDELRIESLFASSPGLAYNNHLYWLRKLQALFHAGTYASALEASSKAEWHPASVLALPAADYHFYTALSHAGCSASATAGQRQQHLAALAAHHQQLQIWAENCPENFESRATLVGAEIATLEAREIDAERLYEQAIRSARANGFVHLEGIAYERASAFYRARGFDQFADLYLRNARDRYQRWGADGKVRQLDKLYPALAEPERSLTAGTIAAPIEQLDLATVVKVSQAVSSEIILEKLIDLLMRTAIEHAGAERGVLIHSAGDGLRIEAEASTAGDDVTVRLCDTPITAAEVPESVVHHAAGTQESVILDDAWTRSSFASDEYIQQKRARSALCLPLVKQGKLIALLYLENNLAPNVFTPATLAVLKVLASSAAVSLENSRLYHELQGREAKIRRLVDSNVVGVLVSTLEGQVREANDAFLKMVGCTREDLSSGRIHWTELTPPEWQAASERAVAQLRANGTCEVFEKEYFRKDGSRVPVLVAAAVIERTANETVAFVLDLTERKQMEAERERLRQVQADLAHISRVTMMGELTASIAHEINQPLTAVVSSAAACLRWLSKDPPNLERVRQGLQETMQEGTRAGEIVKRIRALLTKSPFPKDWVNINKTLIEVVDLIRSEMRRQEITVRTRFAEDLPLIWADKIQLQQVILNLVINALEAMSGFAPAELVVSSEKEGPDSVLVSVADQGSGLEQEKLDRLFEPFYTTKAQGMGMGLAISRSIISAHGGRLWATPNSPRGAVFRFSVPVSGDTAPNPTKP